MPEMAAFCGRRFVVERRAERLCDTVHYTGSRKPARSVFLDDLRCDGSAHDGCQAECRFIWKEAWLRKVTPGSAAPALMPAKDMVTWQAPVPEHAPPQPVKVDPAAAEAVRLTTVFAV